MYAYIHGKPHKSAEAENTEPTQHKERQWPDLVSLSQCPDPSVSRSWDLLWFLQSPLTLLYTYDCLSICLSSLFSYSQASLPWCSLVPTQWHSHPDNMHAPILPHCCHHRHADPYMWLVFPPPVAGTQTSIHTYAHRAPLPRKVVRNGVTWENRTHSGDQTRLVYMAGHVYWSATCLHMTYTFYSLIPSILPLW